MIPLADLHLAAEDVIGPGRVGEDDGHDEERADEGEAEALRRPGGGADRDVAAE